MKPTVYLACVALLALWPLRGFAQFSAFYRPVYATYIPTFDPSTDSSLNYTYYLDGAGIPTWDPHYDNNGGAVSFRLVAHERGSVQITKKQSAGGGTVTTCFGNSAVRFYLNRHQPCAVGWEASPGYQFEGPTSTDCGSSDYVDLYWVGSAAAPSLTPRPTGIWTNAVVRGISGAAASSQSFSFSGGALGLGNSVVAANQISSVVNQLQDLSGLGCTNSPRITAYAAGTFIAVNITVDASNYSSVLAELASDLVRIPDSDLAQIPLLMGGIWGPSPVGEPVFLANPSWDYGVGKFHFDFINWSNASRTYSLGKSVDSGSTWIGLGSFTMPPFGVLKFLDPGVINTPAALYRAEYNSECVGNVVGFVELPTENNKYTSHGVTMAPSSSNIADLIPPANSWAVCKWRGNSWSVNSYDPVGGWDDPSQVISYLDGFFLRQDSSGAPSPRLCGYPIGGIANHGNLPNYTMNGSAGPGAFNLTGINGSRDAVAYQWDKARQTWNSSAWNTNQPAQWSSNFVFAPSEGIMLYTPNADARTPWVTWAEEVRLTCP